MFHLLFYQSIFYQSTFYQSTFYQSTFYQSSPCFTNPVHSTPVPISYPESSGFLVSGATPGRLWGHNLVPRVLWVFGQRVDASRDSGIMEKFNFFRLVVCITMEDRQEVRWSFAEVNQTGNPPTNFLVLEGDLKCQTRCFVIFYVCHGYFMLFFSYQK